MTLRLAIVYGLMLLPAAEFVGVIWWRVYHSPRRSDARRLARQRKSELAAFSSRQPVPPGDMPGDR
jgi:hypothetical protein